MNYRPRSRRRRSRQGFTLMEVLLVLAILVILGTIVVVNFSGVFAGSKIKAAKAQIRAFETQLDIYHLDLGSYPTSNQGLEALRNPPQDLADVTKWGPEPYAKKDIPLDPWNQAYIYNQLTPTSYSIMSKGPDGVEGTEDDITSTSG